MAYLEEHTPKTGDVPREFLAETTPMKPASPPIDAMRVPDSKKQVNSGGNTRERESDLHRRNQLLSAEMALLRINVERVATLIDALWEGSEEGKQLVLEKLRDLSKEQTNKKESVRVKKNETGTVSG